jgi:hypothetical protein
MRKMAEQAERLGLYDWSVEIPDDAVYDANVL